MPLLDKRHAHYVFGILQSGLTSGVATVIASLGRASVLEWLSSWLLSWAIMLPVVIVAAPFLRQIALMLTADTREGRG